MKTIIVLGILFLIAAPFSAAEFTGNSRTVGGGKSSEGAFSYAEDRWRIEERLPKNEYRVTLFRADKKSLYVLWPDIKRYLVQPLGDNEFQIISTRKPGAELDRIELGQETISGFAAVKYLVTYTLQGKVIKNIEWFSKDLGVVIKSHAEDNAWSTEITNIKKGKLDPMLFEVPADFKLLSAKDVLTGPKPAQKTK